MAAACGSRSDLVVEGIAAPAPLAPPPCAGSTQCTDDGGLEDGLVWLDAEVDADVDADADVTASMNADVDGPVDTGRPVRDTTLRIAFFGAPGVYDESSLLSFLLAYPATVTRLPTNASPVTASQLADFDIVVLDQLTRTFASNESAALAEWVHAGGAVLSLTGFVNSASDATLPNSLLASFPLSYASGFVAATPAPIVVTSFAASPVTARLVQVPFWGGHLVDVASPCDGSTQTFAFYGGGAVGAVCEHGAGRLYLWGDEWVEYSSEWDGTTDAPLFWQDAIDWLAVPARARQHPG